MKKVSDFFAVEAFYDEDRKLFYFYYDEDDEKYIYDPFKKKLLKGDKKNFTWETAAASLTSY